MKSNLLNILKNLGLNKNESEIFIFLYKYGTKQASIVAEAVGGERTNIYKALKKMIHKGIISEITKDGTKNFFIADKRIFKHKLEQEIREIEDKKKDIEMLEDELKELEKESFYKKPGIIFFEGIDGIDQFFKDIYSTVKDHNYKLIKMFASNTLDNKGGSKFEKYAPNFLEKLKKENISIDLYLGNGIMILENIAKISNIEAILELPVGNSAIQTIVFGDFVYIAIFKAIPFGIKIESSEFASMMHFLLKEVKI